MQLHQVPQPSWRPWPGPLVRIASCTLGPLVVLESPEAGQLLADGGHHGWGWELGPGIREGWSICRVDLGQLQEDLFRDPLLEPSFSPFA